MARWRWLQSHTALTFCSAKKSQRTRQRKTCSCEMPCKPCAAVMRSSVSVSTDATAVRSRCCVSASAGEAGHATYVGAALEKFCAGSPRPTMNDGQALGPRLYVLALGTAISLPSAVAKQNLRAVLAMLACCGSSMSRALKNCSKRNGVSAAMRDMNHHSTHIEHVPIHCSQPTCHQTASSGANIRLSVL